MTTSIPKARVEKNKFYLIEPKLLTTLYIKDYLYQGKQLNKKVLQSVYAIYECNPLIHKLTNAINAIIQENRYLEFKTIKENILNIIKKLPHNNTTPLVILIEGILRYYNNEYNKAEFLFENLSNVISSGSYCNKYNLIIKAYTERINLSKKNLNLLAKNGSILLQKRPNVTLVNFMDLEDSIYPWYEDLYTTLLNVQLGINDRVRLNLLQIHSICYNKLKNVFRSIPINTNYLIYYIHGNNKALQTNLKNGTEFFLKKEFLKNQNKHLPKSKEISTVFYFSCQAEHMSVPFPIGKLIGSEKIIRNNVFVPFSYSFFFDLLAFVTYNQINRQKLEFNYQTQFNLSQLFSSIFANDSNNLFFTKK